MYLLAGTLVICNAAYNVMICFPIFGVANVVDNTRSIGGDLFSRTFSLMMAANNPGLAEELNFRRSLNDPDIKYPWPVHW